jgi:hypothetical protein
LGYIWILVVDRRMFLLDPLPVIARVGPALAGIMFVIARLFLLASLDKKMLITGQPSREIKWKTGLKFQCYCVDVSVHKII